MNAATASSENARHRWKFGGWDVIGPPVVGRGMTVHPVKRRPSYNLIAARALAGPESRNVLDVAVDVGSEDEQLQAVEARFEHTRSARTDPHRVQFDQIHDLVVELDAPRASQHDVDL